MFLHLRYLALVSLLIMLGGAVYISLYARNYKENDLMEEYGHALEATLDSYVTTVWDRYAPVVAGVENSPYLTNFDAETRRFFQKYSYTKLLIFSVNPKSPGKLIGYYNSNNQQYPTMDGSTPVPVFNLDKAEGGRVNRTLKDIYLTGSTDPGTQRTMIQTIVPIKRTGAAKPEAFVEVYTDLTFKWDRLNYRLRLFMGATVGIFTVLIVVVLITAGRAETIISKQHEVNLELIAAAAQAEAQSRDKSQFLASVSHELRTPLNAIIGFSEIIRNEAKERLDKIYQDYIEDIYASGKHLLSLINDILDFSKAEAGKLQIEWAETDATKVIRNSLRMVLPRAEAAQVTLVEDIPLNHLVIVTDAKKLKQVLLNLLSNAVKFTPAGGEVRCHAWTEVLTGDLNIQVRDTGIGIAPKDISRVMTPFGQVDSALSRKYEGTGLGLPLSKKFVESMGGTFGIESQIKVGTSVTITFPKAPPGWGTAAMADHSSVKGVGDVTTKPL